MLDWFSWIASFVYFFAVIDPIGSVPVFIAVTKTYENSTRNQIAKSSVIIAFGVLLFFIVAGELILNMIEVPVYSFQIAGGIILFMFALTMVYGESKPQSEIEMVKPGDTATFPLAMPSIASPGAMIAVVLQTSNTQYTILEQFYTTLSLMAVLIVVFILFRLSRLVHKVIGDRGAGIISRVMGMLIAAIAVNDVLSGLKVFLGS
jgi:multiple antibiotic resistance protein